MPTTDTDDLAAARERGRREAEALDHRLAAVERGERDDLLAQLGGERSFLQDRSERSEVIWRQQREIDRLVEWHRAVTSSRAWRLVQALRRPFGRAW